MLQVDPGGFSDLYSDVGRVKTECLLDIYKQWDVDAINISARELSSGAEKLGDLLSSRELPVISANIINESSGTPRFKDRVIVTKGSTVVGITGITRHFVKTWQLESGETVAIADPSKILPQVIEQLRRDCDLVVLLVHYPLRRLEELLVKIPEVDVVIGSDGYSITREKTVINGACVSYAGKEGQKLAMLEITPGRMPDNADYQLFHLPLDAPEDPEVKEAVDSCLKRVDCLMSSNMGGR